MNPKLTITVDGKNRAIAVMEGVVSVGAKVDVVLKGLTSDIPLWGDDDGFVGYSLRFRIVDECGHDLVRYPLEETDSWNSTSTGVYESVTAVDFDTDALRHIFEGVVFNDALEFGVILDSVVDAAEYGTGRLKIQQWAVASTEDPTVLPDWRETLAKLQEGLENIETAQSATEMARDEAASAASSAAASAAVSASCATAAGTAQNSARASEQNAAESEVVAGNAADAAEVARDAAAESAKEAAESADSATSSAASAAESAKEAAESADSATSSAASAAESAKEAAESAIAAGRVKSVNGKTGEVVLEAADVGAYTKVEINAKLSAKADLVDGVVPASQLPSYVDDVLEYASLSVFPPTGESGKIYVATDTNLTYRWGGSQYVEVSQSLALGETASTAYAGDKGKAVTDALAAHKADPSNPHAVTAGQVGAYTKAEVDEKIGAAKPADYDEVKEKAESALQTETDPVFMAWKDNDNGSGIKAGGGNSGSSCSGINGGTTIIGQLNAYHDSGHVVVGNNNFFCDDGNNPAAIVGNNNWHIASASGSPDVEGFIAIGHRNIGGMDSIVIGWDCKGVDQGVCIGNRVVGQGTASFNISTADPAHFFFNAEKDETAKSLQEYLDERVPTTRTVNGKALAADVIICAEDVNAYAKEYVYTKTEIAEQISTKASLSDIYSKQELEQLFVVKTTADDTYATKSALEALADTVGEANELLESVA